MDTAYYDILEHFKLFLSENKQCDIIATFLLYVLYLKFSIIHHIKRAFSRKKTGYKADAIVFIPICCYLYIKTQVLSVK